MIDNQLSRNVLLFSCNPIDLLCLKVNGYSSRILSQDFHLDYINRCYFFNEETRENQHPIHICLYLISLRTADAFPVVASLPPKNSVCEFERQNDFRDVKPF